MALIPSAQRRRTAIYLLIMLLAAGGVAEVQRLPSSIFPSVTFPLIRVIADVGEEPAARMMPTVTRPLEQAILRVPGIQIVRSATSRGSSEIDAQFAWGTNMEVARSRVQAEGERVRPTLPSQTRIDVEWMNPAVFPIQGYALTSHSRSQAELRDLAEYTLKPALVRIPGVAQVQIQGGRKREFEVRLDRRALEGWHLSAGDVVSAIQKNNQVLSSGLTERNHELYLTLVNGRVHSSDALARIAIPAQDGSPVALGALGRVVVSDEVSYIRTTANGQPAVLVNIVRQPSGKTTAIASAVQQLFHDRPDLLPKDVQWTNFYDQAAFVSASVKGVRDAILIGVGLAAAVLFVFLRNFRFTVTAIAAIPVTIAIVALALGVMGQTVNLMTMAGIAAALGLIADDAIVVIEHIEHLAASADQAENPAQVGIKELRPALIGSSLSTIVILLPFAVLSGVVGAFFRPLALTMALALVVSFLVALIAIPISLPAHHRSRSSTAPKPHRWWRRMFDWARPAIRAGISRFSAAYAWITETFITHGVVAVATAVALVGAGYWLYGRMATDFLPHMDEGSIILDYWTPPGTSLTDTDEMLSQAEKVIGKMPDVDSYSRRTGTQLGFFITEPNRGDYVIKLKPRGQRRSIDAVINALRSRIAAIEPAIHTDFGQLLEDNIGDLTGGTPQPVDVKVFGPDPSVLSRSANAIATLLKHVSGVEDVFNGIVVAGPSLQVRVRPEAAARYGLTTDAIHTAVEPAIAGTVVTRVRIGERMYDLRVLAPPKTTLADLKIRTPTSALLPLSAVADIATGAPEAEIDRENLRTYVGVTARLSGRDLGSAMTEIRSRMGSAVSLTKRMSVEYGGMYQQQQQSFRGLLYVLLGGLVLVSVVVLFEFGDWRAPVLTSVSAIAVLAGVFLALIISGKTLNISSYVGAIMMVGIVGENAIFVIHEARENLRRGDAPTKAWSGAAHRRLRPVAMTILATALALMPLAMGLGQGSQLMQPLAIAVIGGFVLSGPVVLLLLPGLYRLLGSKGLCPAHEVSTPR